MKTIYVKFFGIFDLQYNGKSAIRIKSTKNRVKKLLGLLLLEGQKQLSDEALVLRIWQDENIPNQETALTKLIYLARKELKNLDSEQDFIIRKDGKYLWNSEVKVESDAQILEETFNKIIDEKTDDEEKLNLGRKAVALYDGEFAQNFDYAIWSLSISEYYNNLFLRAAELACEILQKDGSDDAWEECIRIAGRANRYADETDKFYVIIFRGFKALKRRHGIVEYYKRIVEHHKRNADQSLDPELRKIYDWAIRSEDLTFCDFEELNTSLRERSIGGEIKGAYYCEMEIFRNMAHFILRTSMRKEWDIVVMLVDIAQFDSLDTNNREKKMDVLEEVILKSLRKDDIVSRYSFNQFIIMPFECGAKNISILENRLESNFAKKTKGEDLSLDIINFKMEENGYEILC